MSNITLLPPRRPEDIQRRLPPIVSQRLNRLLDTIEENPTYAHELLADCTFLAGGVMRAVLDGEMSKGKTTE